MRTRAITILVTIVCLVGLASRDGVTQENRGRVVREIRPAVRAAQASAKAEEVHPTVVVETYLLQVDMDALYGFGVAAVPQKADETVTVGRLVSCLANPNSGRVLDSTRVVVHSREHGEIKSTSTEYVKQVSSGRAPSRAGAKPAESFRFQSYNTGSTVEVTTHAMRAAYPMIRLELSYDHSGWLSSETEEGAPPSTVSYDLSAVFEVEDGKAVVAGCKQTGNRGLFLIVRASVVGGPKN